MFHIYKWVLITLLFLVILVWCATKLITWLIRKKVDSVEDEGDVVYPPYYEEGKFYEN